MNRIRKKNKVSEVKRGHKRFLSDDDKIEILSLHFKDKMTQQAIADKFGTTRQNIHRIIKEHERNIDMNDDVMLFNSDEIIRRRNLQMPEREKLLSKDAFELAELSILVAKYKLELLVEKITSGDKIAILRMDIEKLMKTLNITLPYIIPKLDSKVKKKEEPQKPPMQLYRSMTKNS